MIYECVVKRELITALYFNRFNEYPISGYSTSASRATRESFSLQMLQVCHQVYSETASMVYRENTFAFASLKGMSKRLSKRLAAQCEASRI